ncbi:alginate lyase family protein [Pontiella agarivorans]|uniref:Alginate lyase family protein n=1 Tax=Pontiella agarivorans TaxID=3038953 RepID=A0ABU5MSI6_9BACT|nr:alginate lyase family protein [Pontiella agarivorans]MDZ8117073.1 alginate lyase family protein [Pontiella agarivorans]
MKINRPIFSLSRSILLGCLISSTAWTEKINFNADWRFLRQDVSGADSVEFDDRGWTQVSAPHTYNDTDTFDDFSPSGHRGEMNQWGGKTWYRKTFTVPADWNRKTVIIEFEAVRQLADIYCNGVKVGHCENGFVPFGADLSAHLKPGQENVIAVACDNSFVKDTDFGGDRKQVWHHFAGGAKLPWNNPHWHPAHGGIYRNVFLHVSEPLHLTQPLYNNMETVGTYVYALNPSRESAEIGVEAEVKNDTGSRQNFTVRSRVVDRDGQTVLTMESETALPAGDKTVVKNRGVLRNPELWEPKYPYLYTVETEIVQHGSVVDSNCVPFGVRWIEMSTDWGFSINGRHLKLQGWGMKSVDGWPGLGAANPDWMHYYTLEKITEAGGNFLRWGHTCGGPVHLKAADRLGIVTMQPGVDGEGDCEGHAWDIRLNAWRDVVIYFRNHPALLFWEGGNQSTSRKHAAALRKVVDKYDPYGGRAYGHRRANNVVMPFSSMSISTEGSGYIKSLPTVEGEYNREESPRRVWDRKTPPYENWHAIGSYDLTAEQYALNQLYHYEKISRLSHGGGANWIFADSTSGGRVETEVTRASGELDAMRLPKEAYHVCRVIFTDEPDLHLIGHWNYPEGTVKDIHVVADCDEISLQLNGKEIGRKQAVTAFWKPKKTKKAKGSANVAPTTWKHPMLFTFPGVTWEAGRLIAVGFKDGQEIGRHVLTTAGPAVALRLTPLTGPAGLLADGSDVAVFDVEAVDQNGNRCPTFIGRCDFKMTGPGIWRGGYNSGKEKSTNHTFLDLEAGINRVIIRSTREPGTIKLTAASEGLQSATATVEARFFDGTGGMSQVMPPIPEQGMLTSLPLPGPLPKAVKPAAENAKKKYRSVLIDDLSYSGPSGDARIVKAEPNGAMFTDQSMRFGTLPAGLAKGEQIRFPNADWNYSAVDLLQFNVKQDADVYVAHDVRLTEKMEWLKEYTDTGIMLTIGRHQWQLFRKTVKAGDSVLMGSNTESHGPECRMMTVFVVPSDQFDITAIETPRILEKAAKYLKEAPRTVTADRCERSAGGLHDFYSEGDYWWPNAKNPDGPYIRRDGESNPANFIAHRQSMIRLSDIMGTLTSAYLITGEEKYAAQAVAHLKAWFVDEGTRMNPNLLYGQAISGRYTGRSIGIIDTIHLVEVALSAKKLERSRSFAEADQQGVRHWFRDYLRWINTHEYGIKERKANNNHSVCWCMQAAAFAHLVGDEELLAAIREQFKTRYIPKMMDEKGGFPHELGRTKPYGYSLFMIDAMAGVAQLASIETDDLWNFEMADGRGMRLGMEFIIPYIQDKSRWPLKPDIMYWEEWPVRQPSLLMAGLHFGRSDYLEIWKGLDADPTNYEVLRNLPLRHPLLWISN